MCALSFGELESFSGTRLAVFLSLLDAGIPGEETGFFQNRPKLRVVCQKGLGNTVLDGARLTGDTAARDIDVQIELIFFTCNFKRLSDNHLQGRAGKILFDISFVDDDVAAAGFHIHAGDCAFSLTCCIITLLLSHDFSL